MTEIARYKKSQKPIQGSETEHAKNIVFTILSHLSSLESGIAAFSYRINVPLNNVSDLYKMPADIVRCFMSFSGFIMERTFRC